MIYVSGPGHGGQAMIANSYLDGTYTKFYPNITEDEKKICTAFTKLIFPQAETAEDINPADFDTYCLQPALAMRSVIREQMGFADSKESGKTIPDIKTLNLEA